MYHRFIMQNECDHGFNVMMSRYLGLLMSKMLKLHKKPHQIRCSKISTHSAPQEWLLMRFEKTSSGRSVIFT